jgi:hypothetical protein
MVSMVVVQMDEVMAKAAVGAACGRSDRVATRNGVVRFIVRVANEELVGSIAIADTRSNRSSQTVLRLFALIMVLLWVLFGLCCVGLDYLTVWHLLKLLISNAAND